MCIYTFQFLFAQSPQSFQYQAVVRDAAGIALVSQPVNFQISIISGSITGTVEYTETHSATTNTFGIVTLLIGNGTPVTGTFSGIVWGISSHFIKIEADLGSGYIDMGTTQLLSVPYALYSENAGNIPTYTGGTGINVTGTIITNSAPDQTVNLTQSGATTISGTYPNFTISSTDNNTTYSAGTGINITGTTINNTAPNQSVTIAQGGATTVSGTYPNFTISSTDLNSGTPGGLNKTVQFNNSGSFAGDTAFAWDNANKRLGVGMTNPNGRMVIRGSATALPTEPLFEVKNKFGQTVFVVYEDSVNVFVNDDAIQSNRGGFAVSGRNSSKTFTHNYLHVTPDSTRIFTGDPISGFGVGNLSTGAATSYMQLNPDNYFIGHQAGDSISTGLYNSFFGYKCGISNKSGSFNVFSGFKSGYLNKSGNYNTFLGHEAGYTNSGSDNTFIGYESGKSHTTGGGNVYIGSKAGQFDLNGAQNIFVGENAGINNQIGSQNVFLGYSAGYSNNGNNNVFLGYNSGYYNTSGSSNVANGYQALYNNISGYQNVAIGYEALFTNTSGYWNVAIGYHSLFSNTNGTYNSACGWECLRDNTTGSNNSALGRYALAGNTTGNGNSAIGQNALSNNIGGWDNSAIGYSALSINQNGNFNSAHGCLALGKNLSGNNNSSIGSYAIYNNTTGSNNSALGYYAFYAGTTYSNSTALGANSVISLSNKVRIGDATVTVIEGQVAYTFPSDGRFKNNVTEEVKGLDFITKLRPIIYNFDTKKFDAFLMKDMSDSLRNSIMDKKDYTESTNIRQTGFIAQEVEQAAKESGYNFNGVHKPSNDGDNYSVAYSLFTVPLVKAVQEQQKQIEELKTQIEKLNETIAKIQK